MAVLLERRVSSAARWSRRLALFSAVLLLTSVFGHRIEAIDAISLFWLLGLVVGLAFVAAVLAMLGFVQLWEFGDKGGRNSTKGLLVALAVLAPFAYGAFQLLTLPALTDVSTDPVDPPTFFYAGGKRTPQMNRLLPYDGAKAGVQAAYYPEVTGRRYALEMNTAINLIETVLDRLGWIPLGPARMGSAGGVMTVEVAAPSAWIGLMSDIAIRVADEGETTYVDVRSASRYGEHDLGGNAAKINRFFAEMEAEITLRNTLFPVPAE